LVVFFFFFPDEIRRIFEMELKKNALDGINKFEKTRFGDKRGFFSIAFFGFKMFKSLKKKKKKKSFRNASSTKFQKEKVYFAIGFTLLLYDDNQIFQFSSVFEGFALPVNRFVVAHCATVESHSEQPQSTQQSTHDNHQGKHQGNRQHKSMLTRGSRQYENSDAYAAIAGTSSWPEQLRVYLARTPRRCTLSFDDVHAEWFHARCSRRQFVVSTFALLAIESSFLTFSFLFFSFRSDDAERLVQRGPPGAFLVRLSESKENQLALTALSLDAPHSISHSLIRAVHPGFAIDTDAVFASLAALVASRPELRHPVPRVDDDANASTARTPLGSASSEQPLVTCTDVLRRLGERLRLGEAVPELHWTLAALRFDMVSASATRRTVVRFAGEEHLSSYWLPFDANLIRLLDQVFQSCNEQQCSGTGGLQALRINGWHESGTEFVHALADADARLLSHVCVSYDALVMLDLQVNRIGDAGAASLAKCIGRSRSLRAVDLRHNFITHRGARRLHRAMLRNHALVRLDLWPQLRVTPPLNEVTTSQCTRLQAVLDQIDDVFRTRRALLFGSMQLHGFLSHAQAEVRLPHDHAIAYLHADHPMCFVVASRKGDVVTRTVVRRDGNGYASTPQCDGRPRSLMELAGWMTLAQRATMIAKRRAVALAVVEWSALPLTAVLESDARALRACNDENGNDERMWRRLARRLRLWLESGAILDVLWCVVEAPHESGGGGPDWSDDEQDDVVAPAPRTTRQSTLDELLYANRQGMMRFVTPAAITVQANAVAVTPNVSSTTTPTITTPTTTVATTRISTQQSSSSTQKSMFQVKI
jgi:hypothetical protein